MNGVRITRPPTNNVSMRAILWRKIDVNLRNLIHDMINMVI